MMNQVIKEMERIYFGTWSHKESQYDYILLADMIADYYDKKDIEMFWIIINWIASLLDSADAHGVVMQQVPYVAGN